MPFAGITPNAVTSALANNQSSNSTMYSGTQPQLSYMWEVELTGNNGDVVSTCARASAIPTTLIEQTKRYYCGVEYSYAGRDTSPRVFRVTFFDNEDFVVRNFIEEWRSQLAGGEDNKMVSPTKYFRNMKLKMKDTTDGVVTKEYEFMDCYPTEVSETALTYESSELVTFDVMFAYRMKR